MKFKSYMQSVLYAIAISVTFISGHISAQSPPAPVAVKNLAAVTGDEQVTLSWNNPNNASITRYQYRQSADSGSNWSPDWTNIIGSGKNTTSYTVTSLTNGTKYTFEVRAVNASGNGAGVSVSATPALPPLTVTWPQNIKGTKNSSIWTSSTSNPPQISVSGGRPSYTYEIAKEGAPDGFTIDLSGTLTGTPTVSGNFSTVTVNVRDAAGQSVSHNLSITIRPALNFSPIGYKTVEMDSLITPIHLSASGGWSPYTYALSGAPMGISLSSDNRIIGRPSQDGTFPITVTVTDDHGNTADRNFDMSVYSIELAKLFSPILILTKNPTQPDRKAIFPEPVKIMGAESVSNLWFHFKDDSGSRQGTALDFSYQNLKIKPAIPGSLQPLTALINAYQSQYPDIDFSENKFASLPDELVFNSPIVVGLTSAFWQKSLLL